MLCKIYKLDFQEKNLSLNPGPGSNFSWKSKFLSCRPFVVNKTFSTGIGEVKVT